MKGWILKNGSLVWEDQLPDENQTTEHVVCDVLTSALNHRDVWIKYGKYPDIKENIILGSDGCVIFDGKRYLINPSIQWGNNELAQSDEYSVLGMPTHGTFSDKISISKENLILVPDYLTDEEAAALPLAGLTAYRALISRARTTPSDVVLINGIGGGVAMMAFQFALAQGCKVIVTSGHQWKLDLAIKLGAHAGYLYTDDQWTKRLIADFGGVDVIIDSAGGDGFSNLMKVIKPGGRIAIYGGTHGKITNLNTQVLFWRQVSILGSTMGSDQDFKEMVDFVQKYDIKPVIDEVFPLSQLELGMKKMETGQQFGKIIFQNQDLR
ncbi:MAG: zinc-binding dehydrogenase [Lewinellaceae bacterium]|nr:zinc-binding dehydrogenase [Lewinellaceae bacterium]